MIKAFSVIPKPSIYVYKEPVRMHASFRKLKHLVKHDLGKLPDIGDLFLFVNEKRTYLKILFYANEGYCIFAKQLPKGLQFSKVNGAKLALPDLTKLVDYVAKERPHHEPN